MIVRLSLHDTNFVFVVASTTICVLWSQLDFGLSIFDVCANNMKWKHYVMQTDLWGFTSRDSAGLSMHFSMHFKRVIP